MRKLISISLVAVAALSAIGYRNQVTNESANPLTTLNLEALSKKEAWAGVEFAKDCISDDKDVCVLNPFHFFYFAKPYE